MNDTQVKLKALRKEYKLTQDSLSKKIGMPVGVLQHWEQGVSVPPAWVLALIEYYVNHECE